MPKITIAGQFVTQFGELWDRSLADLMSEAILGAVAEAHLDLTEIEAVFVGNKTAGNFEGQHHLNALASEIFPQLPPAFHIEAACASGGLAVIAAEQALLSGQHQTVLVVGVEKMTDVLADEATQVLAGAANVESEKGSTFPGLYALLAQVHMQTFGTTRQQLSAVAVKNHRHALTNPNAQFHKQFTEAQVSASSLVADPLRLLDCSPISDGAAAVVLTTKRVAAGTPQILGFGHAQDTLDLAHRSSLTELGATVKAANQAYAMAETKSDQIQVAEVHDCFTIAELLAIEDLGFFAKGTGGSVTLEGQTTINGKLVINPSGGLKACGHPVGATGVKQIAFLAELLKAGKFTKALAHNVGGSGATAAVHILGVKS